MRKWTTSKTCKSRNVDSRQSTSCNSVPKGKTTGLHSTFVRTIAAAIAYAGAHDAELGLYRKLSRYTDHPFMNVAVQ